MSDYHIKQAREILSKIAYVTIATSSIDGRPWNSPMGYTRDNELNIYWVSDKQSQHSKNIRENGQAFIVIYDSTAPQDTGEAVYIETTATELNNPDDIRSVRRMMKGPGNDAPDRFMEDAIRRVYKAVPLRAWMNDVEEKDGVFMRDLRVELPLDSLKNPD